MAAKSMMKELRASFRRKKVAPLHPPLKPTPCVEQETLKKMREELGEEAAPYTDSDLFGFLKARSWNMKEAKKLIKLDILKYGFSGTIGCDKEGSLVRVINIGGADAKGLMNRISTIDGFKILIWMINQDRLLQEEANRKSGRKCYQFFYILNLQDLSLNQISYKPAFDSAAQALKLLQDHYHEALKLVYFVNSPPFFSSTFKLFKPVIQDSLQRKIKILDHESSKKELLKCIDADVLPQYLGGNLVDRNRDPRCLEFIDFGAVIPTSCYANNFLDIDAPDVVHANIAAGATLNFRFPVRQPGSMIEWHIQGKCNDIGIGMFWEPLAGEEEEDGAVRKYRGEDVSQLEQLTPVIRSQCHVCPEESSAPLWFSGNVVLHFDNTYSWMNSKEVLFKVRIQPPSNPGIIHEE